MYKYMYPVSFSTPWCGMYSYTTVVLYVEEGGGGRGEGKGRREAGNVRGRKGSTL